MILIKDDKSYLTNLDLIAIENGVADLGIHSLRISNYYTEEEKEQNSREFDLLTSEQWLERCEHVKRDCGQRIEKILDVLDMVFMIYQYKNKDISYRNDGWDLFFWCNSTGGDRDMSYVTLNPNAKFCNAQQLETIESVLDKLKTIDITGIQIIIQYTATYNEQKVSDIVEEYCEKVQGQFIDYGGYTGKIVEFNGRYVFKKKGAKKLAYEINKNAVLNNVLAQ